MGFLKDFRKNIMAPMGRPMSIMGIQPRFQSSILPRQPQSREEYNQMAQEDTLFGGQPLQEPIAMPRNPEMVEQINQQMFPQPIPQVPSPLQNAFDNLQKQIGPQPFLQQPQAPQTGGIPVTGGGPLGSGILPVDNLPSGTPPVMGPALGSFKIPTGPAKGGIRGIPGVGTDPSNTDLSTLPRLIPNNSSTQRSILDDFVPPPGYKEPLDSNDPERFNPIPGLTPQVPNLFEKPIIPPRRDDFMSIERIGDIRDEFIPRMPNENPIPFVPPVIPQTPISPPVNIGGPPLDTSLIPQREILERPIIPPKRNDFMSIAQDPNALGSVPLEDRGYGPGITVTPDFMEEMKNRGTNNQTFGNMGYERVTQEEAEASARAAMGGMGGRPDPSETFADYRDRTGAEPLEDFQARQRAEIIAAGDDPDQQVSAFGGMGGRPGEPEPINFGQPPVQTEPVDTPVEPVNVTTPTDPNMSVDMPVAPLDPVLLQQSASEVQTDPLLRSLYFGTQDSPGFYNQLQQAGANLIDSDVPLQQTAGLSPLELLARQQAISGIGGFEPFLQQNQDLVNQAIGQSRRAEALRDPYFDRAERQMQIGLGDELGGIGQAREITTGATDRFGGSLGRLGRQAIDSTENYGGSLGESEDLLRGTLGGYDPSMTQQFYNPYEDRVVQQTIDDVLKAGDKQDIASRAREISSGAFGGSRARLGAEERRESLGKGLAQALGNIRSQGFQSAQATGLGEFARQRAAERAASSGLAGLSGSRLGAQQQMGSTLRGLTGDQFGAQQQLASSLMGYGAAGSGARQNLATGLLGIGQQRGAGASALGSQLAGYGSQIGGIGQTQEQMRAGQRGELGSYGTIGRGIQETGLGRIYEQQLGQQMRPLGVLGQIGSMLPGYQASSSRIDSQYGLPTDPTAAGLGAAFSAYGAVAPRQGQG